MMIEDELSAKQLIEPPQNKVGLWRVACLDDVEAFAKEDDSGKEERHQPAIDEFGEVTEDSMCGRWWGIAVETDVFPNLVPGIVLAMWGDH